MLTRLRRFFVSVSLCLSLSLYKKSTEAQASTRQTSDWDFSGERTSLQSTMNDIARAKKRLADTKMQAAKSQQEVMQLLQAQHQQISQLQVRSWYLQHSSYGVPSLRHCTP